MLLPSCTEGWDNIKSWSFPIELYTTELETRQEVKVLLMSDSCQAGLHQFQSGDGGSAGDGAVSASSSSFNNSL